MISKLDLCSLFSVTKNVEGDVSLVETPLVFPGTDDKVVIRVRPKEQGFRIDDGGDTEWFTSIAGYDIDSASGRAVCEQNEECFSILLDENGVLYTNIDDSDGLALGVLRLAQASISLFSAVTSRRERIPSQFKDDLRIILKEAVDESLFSLEENVEIPETHGQKADYRLGRKSDSNKITYIFAASDKARVLEAELAFLQMHQSNVSGSVLLIVENQEKVGKETFERAGYYTSRSVVFNESGLKELIPNLQ